MMVHKNTDVFIWMQLLETRKFKNPTDGPQIKHICGI